MTTPTKGVSQSLQKNIAMSLAALGVLAAGALGWLNIDSKSGAQCAVDLADAKARLELLTEVRDQCKVALESCKGASNAQ